MCEDRTINTRAGQTFTITLAREQNKYQTEVFSRFCPGRGSLEMRSRDILKLNNNSERSRPERRPGQKLNNKSENVAGLSFSGGPTELNREE